MYTIDVTHSILLQNKHNQSRTFHTHILLALVIDEFARYDQVYSKNNQTGEEYLIIKIYYTKYLASGYLKLEIM